MLQVYLKTWMIHCTVSSKAMQLPKVFGLSTFPVFRVSRSFDGRLFLRFSNYSGWFRSIKWPRFADPIALIESNQSKNTLRIALAGSGAEINVFYFRESGYIFVKIYRSSKILRTALVSRSLRKHLLEKVKCHMGEGGSEKCQNSVTYYLNSPKALNFEMWDLSKGG